MVISLLNYIKNIFINNCSLLDLSVYLGSCDSSSSVPSPGPCSTSLHLSASSPTDQLQLPAGPGLHHHLWSGVCHHLRPGVWDQGGATMQDRVQGAMWDQVWATMHHSLRAAVRNCLRAGLHSSLWAAVHYRVWPAMRDQIWHQLRASLRNQIWATMPDNLHHHLRAAMRDQIWHHLWAAVHHHQREAVLNQVRNCLWNNHRKAVLYQVRDHLWRHLWATVRYHLWAAVPASLRIIQAQVSQCTQAILPKHSQADSQTDPKRRMHRCSQADPQTGKYHFHFWLSNMLSCSQLIKLSFNLIVQFFI